MRNTFISSLIRAVENGRDIYLLVGDLGYSVVEPFQTRFPERFINVGVAEQNMVGIASGLAMEGAHVFVYSIGNFSTFRCAEQIRNDVAYHNASVTIVSVGGGVQYGALGYSHHAVQDYALMRSFPNMLLATPGDPASVSRVMEYLVTNPQPSYLRLAKAGEINYLDNSALDVQPGQWMLAAGSEYSRRAILTTGNALQLVMRVFSDAASETAIFSLPLWGMRYKSEQRKYIEKFDHVTVVEDHLTDGGFGSWILEALMGSGISLDRVSFRSLSSEVCGSVGDADYLHENFGLGNLKGIL